MSISLASKAREIIASSDRTNEDIAEELGTSVNYIRMIRCRPNRRDLPTTRAEAKAGRKERMLENLLLCHGNVSQAAKKTGLGAVIAYCWMAEDPEFKRKVAEAKELSIDFVESALFQQIKRGVPASTIFFLKTRAKHRGYIERSEVTGADGGPLDVRVIVPKPPIQRIEPRDDDILAEVPEADPE